MVKTVSLETARQNIERLIKDMSNKDQYVIEENGQPVAVIISPAEYQAFIKSQEEKEKAWEELFAVMDEVQAQNLGFSEEEVNRDVDEAIRAIRESSNP